jgi:hypothetical protein
MPLLVNGKSEAKMTTDDEHEALVVFLGLLRSDTKWVREFMDALKLYGDPAGPVKELQHIHVVLQLAQARYNSFSSEGGVLAHIDGKGAACEEIDEDEHKVLHALLAIIRNESWFSDWLTLQILGCCSTRCIDDPVPSPLFIAGTLTKYAEEFEESRANAERMLHNHPSQFRKTKEAPASC